MEYAFLQWLQAQGSPNQELTIEPPVPMVFANVSWAAYEENAWTTLSSFMESIYSAWSRNIRLTSTRIDPIKELVSTFSASSINQMRRQQVGPPPERSLGVYTTVIPARII